VSLGSERFGSGRRFRWAGEDGESACPRALKGVVMWDCGGAIRG